MLKCVIQNHDVDTLRDRLSNTAGTIRRRNNGNAFVQPLVHHYFVPAITAKHNSWDRTTLQQLTGKPGGNRGLTGASHGKVADAPYRHGELFRPKYPPVIQLAARRYDCRVQRLSRSEQRTDCTSA